MAKYHIEELEWEIVKQSLSSGTLPGTAPYTLNGHIYRASVPGGWIYKFIKIEGGNIVAMSTTFVPENSQ